MAQIIYILFTTLIGRGRAMIQPNVSKGKKMSLGLTAFDLLASIKLPHIQCGDPMV